MRILCLVKQVPDSLEVRMGSDLTLEREFVAQVLNPADESAVELALRLRDAHGGEVTALSMGPARAEGTLRELISRGVDHAALLCDPACAGSDTLATARALSAAAKALGLFDLLLFGRRAADGETGQVGAMTAALLGIPCVVHATDAEISEDVLTASQLTEAGTVRWRAKLPAALTLCEWSYPLRLPTLSGLRRAKNAPVTHLTHEDIALSREDCGLRGSPTRVTHVSARPAGVRHTVWLSAQEAAETAAQLLGEVKP